MGHLCAVSFNRYGRLFYLDPGDLRPTVGDLVLVPTDDGPEVAEWWRESRGDMAVALAEVLTSAQAVVLNAAPRDTEVAAPAADIGAHVLAAAARAHDAGYDLLGSWSGRLDELSYRAPEVGAHRFDAVIDVHH